MNKHEVGKIASAVVAAAVPAIGALVVRKGAEMAANYAKGPGKKPVKTSVQTRRDRVSAAPVALSFNQPKMGFKTAAPTRKGASARIVGCDYVGPFASSATANLFQDSVFEIYPGNSAMFNRLGAISLVYELYAFNKCRMIAVGVAASTLPGSMTLAPDCYPNGLAQSAAAIRNQEDQKTTKFWETCISDYPCGRATRPWFLVDPSETASDEDSKLGDFHLGIDGTATAATVVCDVFVEYDVEFAQCVSGDGVSLELLNSPLVRRVQEFRHGKEAVMASLQCLLPAAERGDYDLHGRRVRKEKKMESSDAIERFLATVETPQVSSSSPSTIPAAALRSRVFS